MTTLRRLFAFLPFTACLFCANPLSAETTASQYGPYIAKNEGYNAWPYADAGGFSVGFGHHLKRNEDFREYSLDETTELFDRDLHIAVADAQSLMPNFSAHEFAVRQVLVDMAYQLGKGKLKGFRGMLHKIEHFQYRGAAEEIHHSKYFLQCRNRALKNMNLLLDAAARVEK